MLVSLSSYTCTCAYTWVVCHTKSKYNDCSGVPSKSASRAVMISYATLRKTFLTTAKINFRHFLVVYRKILHSSAILIIITHHVAYSPSFEVPTLRHATERLPYWLSSVLSRICKSLNESKIADCLVYR